MSYKGALIPNSRAFVLYNALLGLSTRRNLYCPRKPERQESGKPARGAAGKRRAIAVLIDAAIAIYPGKNYAVRQGTLLRRGPARNLCGYCPIQAPAGA